MQWSDRAKAVLYRTYSRPLDDEGTSFESWDMVIDRAVIRQHRRLWEQAGGTPDEAELEELASYARDRKTCVSGRTLWLGGTPYSESRACSQFNCAFTEVGTVWELVDTFWLLLNGCGVGFLPKVGTLHGFLKPIADIRFIESTRSKDDRTGAQQNTETKPTAANGYEWTIVIGDSAKAWAKALGKLVNPPTCQVSKLTVDFSQIRGPGQRLKGYGWICNGWQPLMKAFKAVVQILNNRAGDLLHEMDVLDTVNHLGTVLSSRRSAQISLLPYGHPRWQEFAEAKKDWWVHDNAHRQQSNNSLVLNHKPTKAEIRDLMMMIWENGGSEPGFINGEAAVRRAPYFRGMNPCAEILLPSSGFCNLVTTNLSRFKNNTHELMRVLYLIARANYRQTCVNLDDGVLQPTWQQTNQSLRLCGVSLSGIAMCPWVTDYQIRQMKDAATCGAYSMADELGLPRPKLMQTVKPEGTYSKLADCTEGIHKPLGRYIFNWINYSQHDPLVGMLRAAGYKVIDHPTDKTACLVCFPVDNSGCRFEMVNGVEVNLDSAVKQLNEYRRWNTLWASHNVSNTISWDISELNEIVDWLDRYWEDFVAVSWLKRNDPTKTAADLGYLYLPQEVTTKAKYEGYTKLLKPVDWSTVHGIHESVNQECTSGMCPVR